MFVYLFRLLKKKGFHAIYIYIYSEIIQYWAGYPAAMISTWLAVTVQASLGVGVWGLEGMLAQNLGPMIILGWGMRSPSDRLSQQ